MQIKTTGSGNNDQTIKTHVAEFLVVQRNVGFIDNDGLWLVSQLPELYWTTTGGLRQRRPGKFLGAFLEPEAALEVILCADPQPIEDKPLN